MRYTQSITVAALAANRVARPTTLPPAGSEPLQAGATTAEVEARVRWVYANDRSVTKGSEARAIVRAELLAAWKNCKHEDTVAICPQCATAVDTDTDACPTCREAVGAEHQCIYCDEVVEKVARG